MESKCDQSYWFWSGRLGQFKPDTWLSLCAESESKIYQLITGKYSYQKLVYKNRKLFGELVDGTIYEIDKDTVFIFAG